MNIKFHIILSSIFLALILVALFMYSIMRPPPAAPQASAASDRIIQVVNATWGENCNPYIKSHPFPPDSEGTDAKPLEPVERNNALSAVSRLCNGGTHCAFTVSQDTLGFNPAPGCFKTIAVDYRCFLIDSIHRADSSDDELLEIDCREESE